MTGKVVALAGGVGGARLAHGLAQLLGERLAVIVNTADDFVHLGLTVCPDLDTVAYTLAGIANPETGWGIENESWRFLGQLGRLGGPDWFRLGDLDLATHVLRTAALRDGERLTAFTGRMASRLGVAARVLPMTDEPVRTVVLTPGGELPFQDYFVRLRCVPVATGFRFDGVEGARLTPEVAQALADPALEAVVLCPSNPFVSLDPILAVPGLRDRVARAGVPVVAVSPIIAGEAVKGPAAKMMRELGFEVSATTVARRYRGLLTGILIDAADAALVPAVAESGLAVATADTLMRDGNGRRRVAEAVLALARRAAC